MMVLFACRNRKCRQYRALISQDGPCHICGWIRTLGLMTTNRSDHS